MAERMGKRDRFSSEGGGGWSSRENSVLHFVEDMAVTPLHFDYVLEKGSRFCRKLAFVDDIWTANMRGHELKKMRMEKLLGDCVSNLSIGC